MVHDFARLCVPLIFCLISLFSLILTQRKLSIIFSHNNINILLDYIFAWFFNSDFKSDSVAWWNYGTKMSTEGEILVVEKPFSTSSDFWKFENWPLSFLVCLYTLFQFFILWHNPVTLISKVYWLKKIVDTQVPHVK